MTEKILDDSLCVGLQILHFVQDDKKVRMTIMYLVTTMYLMTIHCHSERSEESL